MLTPAFTMTCMTEKTPLTPTLNHGMLRSFIEETEEVMGMSSRVALTSEFGDITSEELVNA